MSSNKRTILIFAISLFVMAGCASNTPPAISTSLSPTRAGNLNQYIVPTKTVQLTPTEIITSTALPSPTATPRTHVVKKGEDMGGIAYLYRVSVQDLLAANPTVTPNLMSVGTTLIIPDSKTPQPTENPASPNAAKQDPQAAPTPIPLQQGTLNCTQSGEGGVWCFLPIQNNQEFALEGVSAVIRLAGKDGQPILPKTAFTPLDVLRPGASLPVTAYFSPTEVAGLSLPYQFGSELASALPSADDGRYLPTKIENTKVLTAPDGLSATIQMDASLDQMDGEAKRLWIVAVAYDKEDRIIGVRRWENTAEAPLKGGAVLPVTMNVYSIAGEISRVEVVAESRP